MGKKKTKTVDTHPERGNGALRCVCRSGQLNSEGICETGGALQVTVEGGGTRDKSEVMWRIQDY